MSSEKEKIPIKAISFMVPFYPFYDNLYYEIVDWKCLQCGPKFFSFGKKVKDNNMQEQFRQLDVEMVQTPIL